MWINYTNACGKTVSIYAGMRDSGGNYVNGGLTHQAGEGEQILEMSVGSV